LDSGNILVRSYMQKVIFVFAVW